MNNLSYTLKISSQGQLTLPRRLRDQLHVQAGSRITVVASDDGNLKLSSSLPVEKHFGTIHGLWTKKEQDAADYARDLRNSMQPKR
jgi:AbrB family looped-hinge helix DNA binding protein